MPELRGRLDSFDRWNLREWLTHRVDITAVTGDDGDGEPIPGRKKKNVHCRIDGRRTRHASSHERIETYDGSIEFYPDEDVKNDYLLENPRDRFGRKLDDFVTARVVQPDRVHHTHRGDLVKSVMFLRN